MIVSRMAPMAVRSSAWKAVLSAPRISQQQQRLISTSLVRNGFYYRQMPTAAKKYQIWADAAGAFMWWWIFWHIFTDYHHIIGHDPFPDICAWTDEELGVPPDDADDPE